MRRHSSAVVVVISDDAADEEKRKERIEEDPNYWNDRKVPFRCFYSFAVARAATGETVAINLEGGEEPMPTDKLVDVSPMALRMSSPFNAGYWLTAA